MRTSQKGINLIKSFEGLRLSAYPDPGTGAEPWTIGYGATRGVTKGMTITAEQAERMLQNDVARFEPEIENMVKVPLSQGQWDALMSFTYNLGAANLASSTLLKLLNEGDYAGAAAQFPRWNKAAGKELPGLTKRRLAEQAMFQGRAFSAEAGAYIRGRKNQHGLICRALSRFSSANSHSAALLLTR